MNQPWMKVPLLVLLLMITSCYSLFAQMSDSLYADSLKATVMQQSGAEQIISFNRLSRFNWEHGNIEKAAQYADTAILLANNARIDSLVCLSKTSKAVIEINRGNMDKSMALFFEVLELAEAKGYKHHIAIACNGIALNHENNLDMEKALEYHERALKLFKELGDFARVASSLSNMGNAYMRMREVEKGLTHYKEAAKIKEERNDTLNMHYAIITENIGLVYLDEFDHRDAFPYLMKAMRIRKEIGDVQGLTNSYLNLSSYYKLEKDFENAEFYLKKSIEMSKQFEMKYELEYAYDMHAQLDSIRANFQSAYYNMRRAYELSHELFSEEHEQISMELETKYETEKKERLLQIQKLENTKTKAELKVKQNQQYALFGGIALVLIFTVIIFNRFQVTKKQRDIITENNRELKQFNEELAAQRDQIDEQKQTIEHKHLEITQSINYAQRIQSAILPPASEMEKYLGDHFVLYRPKAVVAGDFYWLNHADNRTFFAVADCTGHGVPGAMVSVVCHGALNRCIGEFGLRQPGEILDKTRELVVETFEKSDEQVMDGMDVALCVWDRENGVIEYAGANNPFYFIRKGGGEIEQIKGTKQPIGFTESPMTFQQHSLETSELEMLYLFSDGFADQFGGPKNKKFGYKKFRQLLAEHYGETSEGQARQLSRTLEHWMEEGGNLFGGQIDDVCVLGVRVG